MVTIILPLVAPILLTAIYGVVPLPPDFSEKTKVIVPIKDGQFCWVGVAFCASAIYEIADAGGRPGGQSPPSLSTQSWWIIGGLIATLVSCSFIAAGGAVFSTPLRMPTGKVWHRHYATLVWSIGMTTVAAVIFSLVHYALLT